MTSQPDGEMMELAHRDGTVLPSSPIPPSVRKRRTAILGVAIVAIALLVAVTTVRTPAPGDDLDLAAAERHVSVLASGPRPMGSPAIAEAQAYLMAELSALGLDPITQSSNAPDWFGAPGRTVEIVNVMARIPGTGGGDALVFMAHYDTVPETPGANDDAGGVAALLEVARVLLDEPPLRNDVIVLFTDGEEPQPRFGATAFTGHPWFADVVLAVNVEAIGEGGPAMLVEMAGPRDWMIDELRTAVADPVAFSFLTEAMRLLGESASDFDVFRDTGIPGFNVAYARGSAIYHTVADDLDALHVDGMAHNGELALGIARHFGDLDLRSTPEDTPTVFFTLPGYLLVSYPAAWSWAVYVAGLVTVVAAVRRRRAASASTSSVGRGLVLVAGASVGTSIVIAIAWWSIASVRSSMGVAESYGWAALLVAGVVGTWTLTERLARRWGADLGSGMLATWAVLGGLSVVLSPAIGYVFVWGTLIGGLALLVTADPYVRVDVRMGVLAAVSVVMLVLAVPLAEAFFLFAGPRPGNPGSQIPATIAVSACIAYLVVGLLALVLTARPGVPSEGQPVPQVRSTTAS